MSELWFRVRKPQVQQKGQAKHETIKQQMSLKGVRGLPRGYKGRGARSHSSMRVMLLYSTHFQSAETVSPSSEDTRFYEAT